jgi:hypothetical protein
LPRAVNQALSKSAYRIRLSVAANDSMKPASKSTCGLKAHITAAVKTSVFAPAWRRPTACPTRPIDPIAARTTDACAPTRTVYAAMARIARNGASSLCVKGIKMPQNSVLRMVIMNPQI